MTAEYRCMPSPNDHPKIALKPKKMIPAPMAARPASPPARIQAVQSAVMESLNSMLITFPVTFSVRMVLAMFKL